jgi:myo-inositol 2-dehydrogenase/D-chiro-inositol 1-dehydrogenase/scyllo-inositol 2-dehydrogenase (NAD+)
MRKDVVPSWRRLFLEAYRQEGAEFIQAIRNDEPTRVSGWDGRQAVAVVNAGNRSIHERRPISLVQEPC